MGDTRQIVLVIPTPDEWITNPYVTWHVYDEKDRLVDDGAWVAAAGFPLLSGLQAAVGQVRRHLRGTYR